MANGNVVVFYVEDDFDDQVIFKECLALARPDIVCEFANDAISALRRLESGTFRPSCIFIDVNMPGMNGNDLLVKIKEIPAMADIPCFMLSTSNNMRYMNDALSAGAEKYLVKPAVYIDFKNLLESTLRHAEI